MQLQINFLVVVILSLAVLILSTILIKNIVSKSSQMTTEVNQQIQKKIQKMLIESGNEIEIPFKFLEMNGNGVVNFLVGIKNEEGDCNEYFIKADLHKEGNFVGYTYEGSPISFQAVKDKIKLPPMFTSYEGFKVKVKKNEIVVKQIPISFKERVPKGIYAFDIDIGCAGNAYNRTFFQVYVKYK